MVDSDRVVGWVRALIAYAVWSVVVVIVWRVVLSLRSVQMSGFALEPFSNEIYVEGLPWVLLIDLGFHVILMLTALALGGRLKREISMGTSRYSRFGNAAYLVGVLGAVAIGYFAFDDLLLPVLRSQNVEWAYEVLFLVLAAGTSVAILFEFVSAIVLAMRGKHIHQERVQEPQTQGSDAPPGAGNAAEPAAQKGGSHHQSVKCAHCGKLLPGRAKFCGRCGAKLPSVETLE